MSRSWTNLTSYPLTGRRALASLLLCALLISVALPGGAYADDEGAGDSFKSRLGLIVGVVGLFGLATANFYYGAEYASRASQRDPDIDEVALTMLSIGNIVFGLTEIGVCAALWADSGDRIWALPIVIGAAQLGVGIWGVVEAAQLHDEAPVQGVKISPLIAPERDGGVTIGATMTVVHF